MPASSSSTRTVGAPECACESGNKRKARAAKMLKLTKPLLGEQSLGVARLQSGHAAAADLGLQADFVDGAHDRDRLSRLRSDGDDIRIGRLDLSCCMAIGIVEAMIGVA
jgi:hypothetical protein